MEEEEEEEDEDEKACENNNDDLLHISDIPMRRLNASTLFGGGGCN
jgi:hypothetical protein